MVGEVRCARPHPGFVSVPVVTGLDYLLFDYVIHPRKRIQRVLCWSVRAVELELFLGRFNLRVRKSGYVASISISPTHASGNEQSVIKERVDHRQALTSTPTGSLSSLLRRPALGNDYSYAVFSRCRFHDY